MRTPRLGKVPSFLSLSLAYFLALSQGLSLLSLSLTSFCALLRTIQYLLLLLYFKPIYSMRPFPSPLYVQYCVLSSTLSSFSILSLFISTTQDPLPNTLAF